MQLTKYSKLKMFHTPGKKISVANKLSRSFTRIELQINQLKHKHLPPQIDFAVLQNKSVLNPKKPKTSFKVCFYLMTTH